MKKLLCAIIVVLLIASVVGAMGYMTKGFKDWTFDQLTKKNDVPVDNKTAIAIDGDGNIMYAGTEYAFPAKMTFLSESDGTSQTITATIKPDDATIPYLDWSLTWENPTSQWASGKNVSEYMTYTVSDDTKVITLKCIKAFGESIKVRAEWINDSSKYAECICEYDRRYDDLRLSLIALDSTIADVHYQNLSEMERVEFIHNKAYALSVIAKSGTTSYKFGEDKHNTDMNVYLTFDRSFYSENFEHVMADDTAYRLDLFSCSNESGAMEQNKNFSWAMLPLDSSKYDPSGVFTKPNTFNAAVTYFYNNSDKSFATLCVDITHNSRVREFRIPFYFNRDSLAKHVTSVTVDNSVLVF